METSATTERVLSIPNGKEINEMMKIISDVNTHLDYIKEVFYPYLTDDKNTKLSKWINSIKKLLLTYIQIRNVKNIIFGDGKKG